MKARGMFEEIVWGRRGDEGRSLVPALPMAVVLVLTCMSPPASASPAAPDAGSVPASASTSSTVTAAADSRAVDPDASDDATVIQEVGAWLDARLGSRRQEAEANASFVRLTPGFRMSTGDVFDERLRVRVKLDLPQTRNRVSLLVLGEDDGELSASSVDLESDRLLLPDADNDTTVGLQFVPLRERLQHVSATASVDSDMNPSASLRWRRSFGIGGDTSTRFTVRPGWRDGDGFTTVVAAELDHGLGDGVLRYALQGRHEDGGEQISSRLGYYHPLDAATLAGTFVEGSAAFGGNSFSDGGRFAMLLRRRLGVENYYFTFLPFVSWAPEGFAPDVQYGFEMEVDIYFGAGRGTTRTTAALDEDRE